VSTKERVLDAALTSFGSRGFEATSLDAIAAELGVRKQTILYYFPSKDALLDGVIDTSADELTAELERTLGRAGDGWGRVEAVVRKVFRIAARRPALLGFLREVSRLGPPASTRLAARLDPLVKRAQGFLEEEMAAGRLRPRDPSLVLLAAYSMVVGVSTEVEVLGALGQDQTLRALVRRRNGLLSLLRDALVP
jgi:AcrR family transcriptional regulator